MACWWATGSLAQPFSITGKLVDAQSASPLPYATVMAKLVADSSTVTGTTTDDNGMFRLNTATAEVFLVLSFIGYEPREWRNLNFIGKVANVGTITLSMGAAALNELVVTGERSVMEFELDKRVFNVGKDISSTGMSAMEVLENVPSVNVDIEGNITLRGNSGVQVLINGKPSVLSDEGGKALGTITADMIERIEVITNPSAKYEASGTSGIINVVLKKDERKGFNGSASLNTGYPANHSFGASINRRTEKFNLFTQLGGGYRSLPDFDESINENRQTGEKLVSDGLGYRNENFYNITLGTDYHINANNVLTLSGSAALELENQPSETEFTTFDSTSSAASAWLRNERTTAVNPKYQYDLQYKKQFKNHKDHDLLFSTLGSFFGKDQQSEFTNTALFSTEIDDDQRTETNFYQRNFTGKLDYTNPLTTYFTLESGAQFDLNYVGNDFTVSDLVAGEWTADTALTNNFLFDQQVYGFYTTAAVKSEKWGLKLGARAEHTALQTELVTTAQSNTQEYTNLFPSAHASYNASKLLAFQAGYSRRIYRPKLWDLNPFFNIRNNYSIRRGNPSLQPEFADSYEVTAIVTRNKLSLNGSLYHLFTTHVIERVSYLQNNVNITEPINLGTRHKTGIEVNGKWSPTRWLSVNGDFNGGYFQRRGDFEAQHFSFTGTQWSGRLTAKFQLPKGVDVEVSGDYQSGYKTVQNVVSGFAVMDAGLRKKLWEGRGVINAGVRDAFASRINESYVDRPDYYLYNFSKRGRFFTLGFSYSFGKGEAMTYSGQRHHH